SLRGLQIHNQLELDRHLRRKVGRLCPSKNLIDVACGLAIRIGRNASIGNETTGLGIMTEGVSWKCPPTKISFGHSSRARHPDIPLLTPNVFASYEAASTTPPPTAMGLPRSDGSSSCSTDA